MRKLRLLSVRPYISGSAFVNALHPDARLEIIQSLSVGDGPLRLDGPSFQTLRKLVLDLDGDQRDYDSKTPSVKLYLPSSLLHLRFHSIDENELFLSLDQAIPGLKALEIVQRGMKVASLSPFFKTQGPFLTSLILLGMDLGIGIDDFYEDEPPEWYDPSLRDRFHDHFNRILPVVSLCPNLVSLEIYDVHLLHLARLGHPIIEIIVLRRESTLARLANMGFFGDFEQYDDAFGKVSMAIHSELDRPKFPQLRTIRYGRESDIWSSILGSQHYNDHGPWGMERRLDALGIEFFDGAGVKWVQSVAGEEYQDEKDQWDDEEEEMDEDEGGEKAEGEQ